MNKIKLEAPLSFSVEIRQSFSVFIAQGSDGFNCFGSFLTREEAVNCVNNYLGRSDYEAIIFDDIKEEFPSEKL